MRSVKIRTEKSGPPLTSNSGCTPDIFPLAWPSNYQYMFALPKTGVAGKTIRAFYLMAKSKTQKKETDSANGQVNSRRSQKAPVTSSNSSGNDENLSPFLR